MSGQLRVNEITNAAGTGAPSFPNQITPSSLGTGTPSSANFLRGDGAWSTVPDPVPAGTAMLFAQTAAPTGWTKSTTHDNKALRVVSGTAGSGGSAAFTTAFGTPAVSGSVSVSGTVGNHTLTTTQMPSHTHGVPLFVAYGTGVNATGTGGGSLAVAANTTAAGGNGAHNHSWSGSGSLSSATATINVAYVDVIIATKN